jgi:hypothetical protein
MSEDRLARIEEKLDGLVTGQEVLQAGQEILRADVVNLDRRLSKVEVNQETMRDDIKQIAEGHGAIQAAITRATHAVIEHIDRRIDPLERALKEHLAAG